MNISELPISSYSPISATAVPLGGRCVRSSSDSRTSPVWPPPQALLLPLRLVIFFPQERIIRIGKVVL